MLSLVMIWALPFAALGRRSNPEMRDVEAHGGVPKLEMVRISSAEGVAAQLKGWEDVHDFGLFVHLTPDMVGLPEHRVAMITICHGNRVLIYDLRSTVRKPLRPLPDELARFLSDPTNTFFGIDLLTPVAQLVHEFGVDLRAIDLKVRGWKEVPADADLYGSATDLLGTKVERPPSLVPLNSQAVYSHLAWALSLHCRSHFGTPEEEWILSAEELAEAKPVKAALRPMRGIPHFEDERQHQVLARAEQPWQRRANAEVLGTMPSTAKAKQEKTRRQIRSGRAKRAFVVRAGQR